MNKAKKIILILYISLSTIGIIISAVFLFIVKDNKNLDRLEDQLRKERNSYLEERSELIQKLDILEKLNQELRKNYKNAIKKYQDTPTFDNYNNAVNEFYGG